MIHITGIHGPLEACSDTNAIKRNHEVKHEELRSIIERKKPLLHWPLKQKRKLEAA